MTATIKQIPPLEETGLERIEIRYLDTVEEMIALLSRFPGDTPIQFCVNSDDGGDFMRLFALELFHDPADVKDALSVEFEIS